MAVFFFFENGVQPSPTAKRNRNAKKKGRRFKAIWKGVIVRI